MMTDWELKWQGVQALIDVRKLDLAVALAQVLVKEMPNKPIPKSVVQVAIQLVPHVPRQEAP